MPAPLRGPSVSRRQFAQAAVAAGLGAAASLSASAWAQAPGAAATKRIASVNSIYRMRSHAYHIAGRFIHGYPIEGFHHQPPFKLARMYNDQYPDNDLSRRVGAKHGVEIVDTVAAALGGKDKLDVDGVLLIVEHGEYGLNEFDQILYPRYPLFQQIVEVFNKAGRSVPVFVDKALSYDHAKAREMFDTAKKMGFGLMAGSSLPVTWRRPEMELPLDTPASEALVCHAGGVEVYGFHALEALQCMLERRAGGETGVKSVRALKGAAVWKAGDDGLWPLDLMEAALSRSPSRNPAGPRETVETPVAILVEYLDGTRATALNLAEYVSDITFAVRVKGRGAPLSMLFDLPDPPGAKYFDALTFNIEKFLAAGKPPYPIERTLLTSTVLDFAMRSLAKGGEKIENPAMKVAYAPPKESSFFRGRYTDAG